MDHIRKSLGGGTSLAEFGCTRCIGWMVFGYGCRKCCGRGGSGGGWDWLTGCGGWD